MELYCPRGIARFIPAITLRRSLSGCTKVFFRKIFSVKIWKIFCEFSVGMELENAKTESVNENENKENKNVDEFKNIFFNKNRQTQK